MKKHLVILMSLFSSVTLFSQVGINTENPQQLFHTDGKSSAATTNPTTGVPSVAQQVDDVVITNQGRVGIGVITPTQSLDVNGRTRIRNTDILTSTTVSPIFVDENGLVGKANISPQSQIAFFTSTSTLTFTPSNYNTGSDQIVPITSSNQSLNTINATIPSTGNIRINQSGNYLIGASLNFGLRSPATDAKIFMALNIDVSRNGGTSWTSISGARPIFVLYWSAGMNQSYTLPTVINNFNVGDLIRIKFYRTFAGTSPQGDNLDQISLQAGYGAPSFTLSLTKL
ncbi:hypothetical protein [Empedobacter tilapiae]|uniref:hypothetical protein n=1 Tax=Empedobacter tilapiae TaxID=2491114 RepID=UPI0028D69708|nr:hypothetical protein [Empedobacter tilapiae]